MITADDVKSEKENEGKMYRNGYDKLQQPIMYMKPGKGLSNFIMLWPCSSVDNTSGSDKKDIKVKNLIYMMEKCARAAYGSIYIDFSLLGIRMGRKSCCWSSISKTTANWRICKTCPLIWKSWMYYKTTTQVCYFDSCWNFLVSLFSESLYKALIYNSPWSLSIFWNMISPFLEDVTRQKIVFVKSKSEFLEHVEEDQLEASYDSCSGWSLLMN